MSKKMDEIIKKLSDPQIKAVSFDMFDTLITRPCLAPEDIFTLMESQTGISFFKNRRQAAEKRARLLKDFYANEISIDEIYQHYQAMFGVSAEQAEQLKNAELQLEYDLACERKSVKRLYQHAKLKGKKIVVVSDMYLPADWLRKILVKCGYDASLTIYVSCEHNAIKKNGELFEQMKQDLEQEGIFANHIIHVGDRKQTDIKGANEAGIEAVHIPSAVDRFMNYPRLKKLLGWRMPVYDGNHSLLLGLLANLLFDDPFIDFEKDSRYNGDPKFLGFYLAPFFVSFCLWLAEETHKDGVEQLALVWRDGYLIEKILDILEPHLPYQLPIRKRVHLSRAVRYPFFARRPGGLFDSMQQWILDPETNVSHFIEKYLMLTKEEDINAALTIFIKYGYVSRYQKLGPAEDYIWFVHEFEPLFQKGSQEHIALVGQKLEWLTLGKEKTGVYDIGYRGTVSRFLKEHYHLDSNTYHMLGTMGLHDGYEAGELKAFMEYGRTTIQSTKETLNWFFELVSCEQAPGVVGFEQDSTGMVRPVTDTLFEADDTISAIQEGILMYAHACSEIFQNNLHLLQLDRHIFWSMVVSVLGSPNQKDAGVIRAFRHNMSYFSGNMSSFEGWYSRCFPPKKK